MLYYKDIDPDQMDVITRLYEHDETLLIAPTGGGKTVCTLTAIHDLIVDGVLDRALVIAPLKVCDNVWKGEHKLWEHLKHLSVGVATGDDFNAVVSNPEDYDIIVVNFDMVPFMCEMYADMFDHVDGLVVDEGTKMARGGVWFKKIRKYVKGFKWRAVMSATPITEGWDRLFYQTFLVDAGRTFGRNKQLWKQRYFYALDYKQYNWAVIPGQEQVLAEMVAPIVHTMPDYKHKLPPFTLEIIPSPLPPEGLKAYKEMAGTMQTEGVTAQNAAVKVNKLQQIASGFIYDKNGDPVEIHSSKYDKLEETIKKFPRFFDPDHLLVIYQYDYELKMLLDYFPFMVELNDAPDVVDRWNAGKIKMLGMHYRSGSHGLNMAQGGHEIIWLGPIWSLDAFTQQNERLWRRGQTMPVTARVLVAPDTVDELILARHNSKAEFMPSLLDHLKKVSG